MNPAPAGRVPVGVRRLDDLLEGGVPAGSATLVYGAPFLGKEVLGRAFLLASVRTGLPAVVVLTGAAASDVKKQLLAMEPEFPKLAAKGLVHFVDCYSKSIGAEDDAPDCTYVDGALNLNGIAAAVNAAQARFVGEHPRHRLLLDSVSTLVAYTNPATTFRFLQVFVGKAKRSGATAMLLLDRGMHTDADVQMFKHLMDGVIEVKTEQGKNLLRVEGIGVTEDRGWVEYRFSDTALEITGSFAAGRIR